MTNNNPIINGNDGTEYNELAEAISGQVWHSGGGIFGVRVVLEDSDFFFGFADGTLGWDYSTTDGDFIGGGFTDLTIDKMPEVIARCQEVIATKEYDTMTAQGHTYRAGDPVIYSVYPSVANGTGIITPEGIKSTGQTLRDVTAVGLGDICTFDAVYDIRPDPSRPCMVYDPLFKVWRANYNMPTRK